MRRLGLLLALTAPAAIACSQPCETTPIGVHADAIIGGDTEPWHPYVVAIGDYDSAFCSATLVSAKTVVTAAHCGALHPSWVHFGAYMNGDPKPIPVVQQRVHPLVTEVGSGEEGYIDNDVAVLKLAEPAPVQPAPLLRETMDGSARFLGPDMLHVGYGVNARPDDLEHGDFTGFGVRRSGEWPFTHIGAGAPLYPDSGYGWLTSDMMLKYESAGGLSECFGDSGGATFFLDEAGVYHLIGVTSMGDDLCAGEGYDQRVDKPVIDAWVQGWIDEFEADNPCRNDGVCTVSCQQGEDHVVDPDCTADHCGADGVCAYACGNPRDPDCDNPVNKPLDEDPGSGSSTGSGSSGVGGAGGESNTAGNTNSNAEPGAAPTNSTGGCSSAGGRASPSWWLFIAAAWLAVRRTRRAA